MRTEWKKIKIGLLCKRVTSGGTPKSTNAEYYANGNIPWLNSKEVNFSRIYSTEKYITEKGLAESSAKWIDENSVIVAMYGATAGQVAITKIPLTTNQACCNLTINEGLADYRYIYYYLSNQYHVLAGLANGGAQQNLNAQIIKDFEIHLPDLKEQKAISDILSSLDDKIELNTQINHNLEKQAKAIFKSWFVDFEPFAGKEPDGLKVVDLQSICELVTKGTTPTTLGFAFTPDGINFIKAESISDTHSFDIDKFSYIDQQTNNALKRSIIQDGDILFTIAGTLGRFAIADKSILPANTNQAVAIIRPKPTEVHPYYIYSFLLGGWHTEYYRKRVQQAVQANLSLTTIKSLSILLLPEPLKQRYENIIVPLFTTILQNTLENRTLCKLRDLLLPKLMSGEIDVSEVEI